MTDPQKLFADHSEAELYAEISGDVLSKDSFQDVLAALERLGVQPAKGLAEESDPTLTLDSQQRPLQVFWVVLS